MLLTGCGPGQRWLRNRGTVVLLSGQSPTIHVFTHVSIRLGKLIFDMEDNFPMSLSVVLHVQRII